jgi:hypothetical protein
VGGGIEPTSSDGDSLFSADVNGFPQVRQK